MAQLTLLNLSSQREAVGEYIKGWKVSEILAWMQQYGKVTEPRDGNPDGIYVFESHSGFKDAFQFTEQGLDIINSGWLT